MRICWLHQKTGISHRAVLSHEQANKRQTCQQALKTRIAHSGERCVQFDAKKAMQVCYRIIIIAQRAKIARNRRVGARPG